MTKTYKLTKREAVFIDEMRTTQEVIQSIFDITQNTPEYSGGSDPVAQAKNMDDALAEINQLADEWLNQE